MPERQLRDTDRGPFFYVTVAAASVLRASLTGKRLTTARAIYDALAELSNEARSSEFRVSREKLALYAGVTDRTVDAYRRLFIRLGLVEVVPRPGAANIWRLLEPDARGEANNRAEAKHDGRGAKPNTGEGRSQLHGRGEAKRTPLLKKKDLQEGKKVIPFKNSARNGRDSARFAHYDDAIKPG